MKQKFRFAELYRNNRTDVEKTLSAMWCGEARNESQRGYIKQLRSIIREVFAPSDAMPLVQCMNSYKGIAPEHVAEFEEMVGALWRKTMPIGIYYEPYEHQYLCWKALLKDKSPEGKNMSIVVTTGTGSGKTECFMIPLVQDLIDNYQPDMVQAIFLYPLNALMEDQKARMQKLLNDTPLKFAVYNGDMPDHIPNAEHPDYAKTMRKIDNIRGITRDENGEIIEEKFPNIIATREELRHNPANILLTNPTMLEYIMLRDKDKKLIHEKQDYEEEGTLRWIALDETHTYTGAGAAEIAMLLRRVLLAYGVTTDKVRFATSSATIGNNADEQAVDELKKFIAGITGLQESQVCYVNGERKGLEIIPEQDKKYWLRLANDNKDGYIRLDELIDEGVTIEEKLERLDEMCQRAEDANLMDLRVKVHYFYRVPNHGLYVDISDPHYKEDGSFLVYSHNKPEQATLVRQAPLLEMSRCKHCGEYLAIAEEVQFEDGIGYQPISMDDSDMFDLDNTEDSDRTLYVFGTTNSNRICYDNNIPYIIEGNRMLNVTSSNPAPAGWRVIANTQCQCPYCGAKLTKQSKFDEDNPDAVQTDEEDAKKLQKFRIAPDFISRLIAPSTLDQMTESEDKSLMHRGQQFISFVDSRQMAASATINQNLEEERLWVYGTIFHELCLRATNSITDLDEAKKYYEERFNNATSRKERREIDDILDILEGDDQEAIKKVLADIKPQQFISWNEILDLFEKDPLSDIFIQQFAERSELSSELDDEGNILPETKRQYLLAIMVDYLSKRPLVAGSPETMGLFTSYYKELDRALADNLPEKVCDFNELLSEENQITRNDWKSLLQIFLDFVVRSNQSVFLKISDNDPMDIFKCVRYATKKELRRPSRKPVIKDKGTNRSRIIRLLAQLIAKDKNIRIQDAINGYKRDIQDVIDCLWDELIDNYKLLEFSTHYDEDLRQHARDKDLVIDDEHYPSYRLNLTKLGFKLYENVYLCDTNTNIDNESNHVQWLRPIEVSFHGYSPYLIGSVPQPVDTDLMEKWGAFPYHNFSNIPNPTTEQIESWAKTNRKILWDNDIWGEDGSFSNRLLQIHQFPDLFIQAEHTAQVDKMVSRKVQEDFKKHKLNILACSTTMEMGVDLGDLELVMMTSVPPMPSNYKQRAGRSGRRGQIRSACITLCGSDAVGIRTLLNPMENVVLRTTNTPTVDLNSAQVIQRHINAFLIREFGVFGMAGGSVTEQVLNYYTNYEIVQEGDSSHFKIKKKEDHAPISPIDGLGDSFGTPYEEFNKKCSEPLNDGLSEKLRILLNGTILGGRQLNHIVAKAREMNENCYSELELRIQDYAEPYKRAKSAKQQSFFEMKFIEPLAARLLSYWATHRFTPNANMPVNVVEFDVNSSTRNFYTLNIVSNPSYPLRIALSQYAPGNPIARDGIVRTVRGIRYTNFFKPEITFKKLYFNREQVVIDQKDELDNLEKWKVSAKTELDLLEPAEFIPDMNESANRILDKNVYTRVDAQLIGADEWKQDRIEPHLFDTRSSREGGNGQILYYNEGVGFGYCHCTKCGRTVLEGWAAASSSDPEKLPAEMNPIESKDSGKPDYHFSLIRKGNRPNKCIGCCSLDNIKRNVVLGDTIQTDYTEIRVRHFKKDWINSRANEEKLLVTLGLLFTRALSEELNVERTDIDFTITPNGYICIFDTNPGGSGYSNQLAAMDLMKEIIKLATDILTSAERSGNNDVLIDKFTLHYVNQIDIVAAKNWILEETEARKELPDSVKEVFGNNVTETSIVQMQRAFANAQNESTIFVDDDYKLWEYSGGEHCWKGQFIHYFTPRYGQQVNFCIAECGGEKMSEPIINMVREIKGWANDVLHIPNPYVSKGLYPLAFIDGRLYFTNNPNHITMNDQWGNGTIYYIRTNNFALTAESVNTETSENKTKIFLLKDEDKKIIKSTDLGEIIYNRANSIVDLFIAHCQANKGQTLKIYYQDEHMKSVLGIMLSLQTISYYIKKIGLSYTLDFKIERYRNETGRKDSICINQPTSADRDQWLESMANAMVEDLEYYNHIEGQLLPIFSVKEKTLTHWRVLSFECAGKKLMIFPDGGFMNGWWIHNNSSERHFYDLSQITYDTDVDIYRNQDIKFDVTIEE